MSLNNRVRLLREAAGLSQSQLAGRLELSRQSLIKIEAGRQVPSTTLALLLARTLGCRVEDLFALPSPQTIYARMPAEADASTPTEAFGATGRRVVMGRVAGVVVAHGIGHDPSVYADGVVAGAGGAADGAAGGAAVGADPGQFSGAPGGIFFSPSALSEPLRARAAIRPFDDGRAFEHQVLVAGCAPLLAAVAHRVAAGAHDTRVCWLPAPSERALRWLSDDLVHIAGVHSPTADGNVRAAAAALPGRALVMVNLTRWRQGLVLGAGNPLDIQSVDDLARPDLRFALRQPGAEAHRLLDRLAPSAAGSLAGPYAQGHRQVAQLVGMNAADVGVAIESVAIAAGLDFIPLSEERFDLIIPAERAEAPVIRRLIDALDRPEFRAQAGALPGYDLSICGHTSSGGGL